MSTSLQPAILNFSCGVSWADEAAIVDALQTNYMFVSVAGGMEYMKGYDSAHQFI